MFDKVIDFIQKRVAITKSEIEETFKYSSVKKYRKGEHIIRAGEYCRFVGFLTKGLITTTVTDNTGTDKANNFIYDGCFFTYVEGLSEDIPSHKNFIALEDCEAIVLNKQDLAKIFKSNPQFIILFSQILAEDLKNRLLAEESIKIQSLEERYYGLEKQFPNAFQRIPLKYLAGYLGIEPQSLSRLRRKLTKKIL
ncbi:MAG: Crp/Fnr family transcriptional regulator [Sphingobacteriales bacterium]|nr:Crp/Fnr family transcriptional regulator [Sphingobacteriales bacterium]